MCHSAARFIVLFSPRGRFRFLALGLPCKMNKETWLNSHILFCWNVISYGFHYRSVSAMWSRQKLVRLVGSSQYYSEDNTWVLGVRFWSLLIEFLELCRISMMLFSSLVSQTEALFLIFFFIFFSPQLLPARFLLLSPEQCSKHLHIKPSYMKVN